LDWIQTKRMLPLLGVREQTNGLQSSVYGFVCVLADGNWRVGENMLGWVIKVFLFENENSFKTDI
jgi:hypothetical protein